MANPLIYRAIIDDGIIPKNTDLIVDLVILLVVLAIADAGLSLWQRWISAQVGEGLIFDMRTQVFAHFQRMPISFFTRTQTGALVSRLNSDVTDAQQAFTDTFSSVIGNILGVTFTLIVMFFLSWQITLIALALLPIIILPARFVGHRIQVITRESYNLNASMTSMMAERFNVAGALLVKLFGEPDIETTRFEDKAGRVRDIGITRAMYTRLFMAAVLLTASLATALTFGLGGLLAANGTLEVGTLVAMTAYLVRLYGPLTALSNVQVDIMTALVSFDRVFEVLDLEPMILDETDAVVIPARSGHDRVRSRRLPLSDRRRGLAGLARVGRGARPGADPAGPVRRLASPSCPGQLVALVGPSGAGKTTISHLIPRLYDVRSGAIRINGVDVRDATLASVHAIVGVVTQDAHLFHETIRTNLLYARPGATDDGADRGAAGGPHPAPDRIAAGWARHARRRSRLPACRAARSSASRSPGSCSRRPTSSSSTRPRPISTRSRRWRSSLP